MIVIRGLDVIEMIRRSHSFTELKMIRDALHDEHQIAMLSNKTVFKALSLIAEKIQAMPKEDMIREILENILW